MALKKREVRVSEVESAMAVKIKTLLD